MLTLVVAMTAGCRAVLLAATAFWLAGRRLLKTCIYRDGVLVFRQEGTSDRPLPVSISGARSHGPSVGCRSGCVLRHRVSPGGLFIAATEMASCCSASLLSRLHLACADFMLGQVDLHVEMASSRPFNPSLSHWKWPHIDKIGAKTNLFQAFLFAGNPVPQNNNKATTRLANKRPP